MSIFVNQDDLFKITIYYKEFFNDDGALLYTDVAGEKIDGWDELNAYFCQPSVGIFSYILEEATVLNGLNQKPVIRTRALRDLILTHLMKKWDAKMKINDVEMDAPINDKMISELDIKIANELFLKYIMSVKLDVLLQAVIKNESENDNMLRGL